MVTAEVAALPAPKQEFKTLLEVAQQAQAQEHTNTQGIHAVYEAAVASKDYPASRCACHPLAPQRVVASTRSSRGSGKLTYSSRTVRVSTLSLVWQAAHAGPVRQVLENAKSKQVI